MGISVNLFQISLGLIFHGYQCQFIPNVSRSDISWVSVSIYSKCPCVWYFMDISVNLFQMSLHTLNFVSINVELIIYYNLNLISLRKHILIISKNLKIESETSFYTGMIDQWKLCSLLCWLVPLNHSQWKRTCNLGNYHLVYNIFLLIKKRTKTSTKITFHKFYITSNWLQNICLTLIRYKTFV
jgi:hypothetical protein